MRLEKVGVNLKQTDDDLMKLAQQVEGNRADLSRQLADRCDVIEGQAKFFRTLMTEKTDSMSTDLREVKENVDGLLNGNTSAVMKLENRLVAMEHSVADQNNKISNLLVLNGDMLERISKSEAANDALKVHVEVFEKKFNEFETNVNTTMELLKEKIVTAQDAQLFLDKNMMELKGNRRFDAVI